MNTLQKLCNIAIDFKTRGNASPIKLMKESGYSGEHLDESEIITLLKANPQIVKSWIQESADNRATPSWYVIPPERSPNKTWIVGVYPETQPKMFFNNEFSAVAMYLKKYIADLYNLSSTTK